MVRPPRSRGRRGRSVVDHLALRRGRPAASSPRGPRRPTRPLAHRRSGRLNDHTMALIVQKFGGTSVADLDRIRNVARRVARTRAEGHEVAVVVSAMAGETN